LSVLFEAGEDSCPVKIILEKVNLALIRQIVASWIKAVNIDPRQRQVVQILVQALLRGQLAAIWKMVIKLITA
jgi:hypothetical protein